MSCRVRRRVVLKECRGRECLLESRGWGWLGKGGKSRRQVVHWNRISVRLVTDVNVRRNLLQESFSPREITLGSVVECESGLRTQKLTEGGTGAWPGRASFGSRRSKGGRRWVVSKEMRVKAALIVIEVEQASHGWVSAKLVKSGCVLGSKVDSFDARSLFRFFLLVI